MRLFLLICVNLCVLFVCVASITDEEFKEFKNEMAKSIHVQNEKIRQQEASLKILNRKLDKKSSLMGNSSTI